MNGKFVRCKSYDFVDNQNNRVQGANAYVFLPDSYDCVKASIEGDSKRFENMQFGQPVNLEVKVSGRYAKYILK